ncbi:MAG: signal peptidase II [Gammaproteobacteria bacterium]|jgi:signal peptidase II
MMRFLWLSLIIVVLDQVTKIWIDSSLMLHDRVPVIHGFFDLMKAYNEGAAFSFLAGQDGWQRWFFTGLSTIISIALLIWLRRLQPSHLWTALAISLVIGGAVGNLIDRVALGHVVDFLLFYIDPWYWPAFNIADSAISIGVVILIITELFGLDRKREAA